LAGMIKHIIRRLLWTIPVLIVISLITFALMHAVPGGPFTGQRPLPAPVLANLNAYYHLDQPLWRQYLIYVWDVLHGDFGPTYTELGLTVNNVFAQHFPISIILGCLAFFVAVAIGIPLGIIASLHQNKFVDYLCSFFAVSGVSIPEMTLGPLLIFVFALKLGVLPVARWGTWQQAVLPALTFGIGSAAILARLTRASMLQVLREDFVRTAKAKGVSGMRLITRHTLRNALIPVVTTLGPLFAGFITGSMVIEQIFAIPGLGKYFILSVTNRDYPVIMGTTLLFATILVLANLAVDIVYAWLDPRIRLE